MSINYGQLPKRGDQAVKRSVIEYTDLEINTRLAFADMLIQQLLDHSMPPVLPSHLETELQALLVEQLRRQKGIAGEGI